MAGATQLQPGEYQMSVENDKATLHRGRVSAENTVKVETAEQKYPTTSVVMVKEGDKYHIREIHVGGTTKKLVFTETQP